MVDDPDAPKVQSVEEMAGKFSSELMTLLPRWKQQLIDQPADLASLETDVHAAFARGADLVVAGLIAVVMGQSRFAHASEQTRRDFAEPLRPGRQRTTSVRLLGGLLIWVASLYCAPRGSSRGEKRTGLYVELAQFGCGKGVTPGLESAVARQAALGPSLHFAQQELQRKGVRLNVKTVHRITCQCGESLLEQRKHRLMLFREGELPATEEMAGCHVSVQIDGGRTKLRGPLKDKQDPSKQAAAPEKASKKASDQDEAPALEDAPGRSKPQPAKTYDADWREPKLITIFALDAHGRMKKDAQATIDGTFLGPDAIAELAAMHLHRLGAAKALSVTFVADGATWIWDRIDRIVELAKLEDVPIHQVLDNCHAAHHISLALAAFGASKQDRRPMYRSLRTQLRNGHWREVVQVLSDLASENSEHLTDDALAAMETEIAYLRKHGEAGRLSYPYFRRLGLPLGSGAIESSIRRVINLRLKSNGAFWREANAESMLLVRALVISDRWDAELKVMRAYRKRHPRSDWRWEPRQMRAEVEGSDETAS